MVNLTLQHRVQVIHINVCVLDQLLSRLGQENNFNLLVDFVHEQVHNFKHESWLDWQKNICVQIRVQAVQERVQEMRHLLEVGRLIGFARD